MSHLIFNAAPNCIHSLRNRFNFWMDSFYKLFIPHAIFNVVTNYIRSFRSELISWIDSSYKWFIFHVTLNYITNCIHSLGNRLNFWMDSFYKIFIPHVIFNVVTDYGIYFEADSTLEWISTIKYSFLMSFSMLSRTTVFTSTWTQLLNGFLL